MSRNDSKKTSVGGVQLLAWITAVTSRSRKQATEVEQDCDYVDSTRTASAQRPTMIAYHRILPTPSRALATSPIVRYTSLPEL